MRLLRERTREVALDTPKDLVRRRLRGQSEVEPLGPARREVVVDEQRRFGLSLPHWGLHHDERAGSDIVEDVAYGTVKRPRRTREELFEAPRAWTWWTSKARRCDRRPRAREAPREVRFSGSGRLLVRKVLRIRAEPISDGGDTGNVGVERVPCSARWQKWCRARMSNARRDAQRVDEVFTEVLPK